METHKKEDARNKLKYSGNEDPLSKGNYTRSSFIAFKLKSLELNPNQDVNSLPHIVHEIASG